MGRDHRTAIAHETLAILNDGHYTTPAGTPISIAEPLAASIAATRLITPPEWRSLQPPLAPANAPPATIEVTAETTLAAARRLSTRTNAAPPLALNFASAKNPGGGFLSGSQAQEESLARASGLYQTLLAAPRYYSANRASTSLLYTDHAILSPRVPVFRDDADQLLDHPYPVTFITMPAPNRGAIDPASQAFTQIVDTLRRRIRHVLSLAAATNHPTLILGAWGCGVFQNDPHQVATLFAEALHGPDHWAKHFHHICFAIYDRSPAAEVLAAFQQQWPS